MNTIKLHETSEEFLRTVFSRYEYCDKLPEKLVGRFTIHMYAESDTYEGGELNGYFECLFFRVDIYDTVNLKKYSVRRRDGINARGVPVNVRIFKDGSTVLFGDSDFEISIYQCIDITPVGYFDRLREEYELKN